MVKRLECQPTWNRCHILIDFFVRGLNNKHRLVSKTSVLTEAIRNFFLDEFNFQKVTGSVAQQVSAIPDQKQRIAQLEYAKELFEKEIEGIRFHWPSLVIRFIASGIALAAFFALVGRISLYRGYVADFVSIPFSFVKDDFRMPVAWFVLSTALGFLWYNYRLERAKSVLVREIQESDRELIKFGLKELSADKDQFFTRLVTINFTYLDLYYRQTKQQANKSFWVSVVAAVAGFGMVIAGIYLLYANKVESGYVTTASGAISQFIAAVFFYLYNRTILSMSQYHQKLVITQNVSLALKTAENLSDPEKATAKVAIIRELTKNVNSYLSAVRGPGDDLGTGQSRGKRGKTTSMDDNSDKRQRG